MLVGLYKCIFLQAIHLLPRFLEMVLKNFADSIPKYGKVGTNSKSR